MATSRHARRKAAQARKLVILSDALRRAEAFKRDERNKLVRDTIRKNMSNPHRGERTPKGLGNRSIYTGSWPGRAG